MADVLSDKGAPFKEMDWPLEFGAFIPPVNVPIGNNTNKMLHDNVALCQHLDRLGYSEAWIGEHHSGGTELIASPEVFIAHAAAKTERIRFGTGVISLPYHHPLNVAQRITLLDHMTKGRLSVGVGPGLLATDAYMLGIEPTRQREMMAESLEVILELLAGERVTRETDWFTMREGALQLSPYSFPRPELCLAATFTPSGPENAAKYGAGLLSLAAATEGGFEALDTHWKIYEEGSKASGHVPDRRTWRHVVAFHIAPTEKQAIEEVEYGLREVADYLSYVLPGVGFDEKWSHKELVEKVREGGFIIGTPDDAAEVIQKLWDKSGGFGKFLSLNFDMADREARWRSYELFAEEVMPVFNGFGSRTVDSANWTRAGGDKWLNRTVGAIQKAGGLQENSALQV